MDHRPLRGIRRPLNILSLKLLGLWLIVMAVSLTTARWMGNWGVILLVFGGLIAIGVVHSRFGLRYLMWTMLTTHCPQCGMWPMNYKGSPSRNSSHGYLICERCQIEWDLGQDMGAVGNNFDPTSLANSILKNIDDQIQNNEPPETRQTIERLTKEGHTLDEARRLISTAGIVEVFHQYYDRRPFDRERFVWNLARLPQKPWDARGKEIYKDAKRV